MKDFVKELKESRTETINKIVVYVVNTLKAKAMYNKGGWKEVRKHYDDSEYFNHHFSITATGICMKLRENKEPINISVQSSMKEIEVSVNELIGVKAVDYYVDRNNHALKIVI
jgi:hypothetical protein